MSGHKDMESIGTETINIRKRIPFLKLAVVMAIAGMPAVETHAAEWTIAPYLWGSDINLDLTIKDDLNLGADVPLSDLVDKLEMAFMGHFEVRGEKWGAFFDVVYLSLADSKTVSFGPGGPIINDQIVDTDMKLGIYELAGLYRFGQREVGSAEFDLIFGARQIDLDQDFEITDTGPGGITDTGSINISETDILAGGRILGLFSEKWGYNIRADYATGGTDGTVNLFAGVSYTFGQTGLFSLDLGYRYMKMKLSDDQEDFNVDTEITTSGPLLGFIFNF